MNDQTLMLFLQTLKNTILLSFGGITVIAIGLSAYFGNLIANKLIKKWNEQSEKELKRFQSEIDKKISLLNSTLVSYASSQNLLGYKRLNAVEIMWNNIVDLRKSKPVAAAFYFYNVFNPNEYEEAGKGFLEDHGNYNNEAIEETGRKFTDVVEKQKIFLGSHLWSLFYGYRTMLLRLSFILYAGIKREYGHRTIISWTEDKQLMRILGNLIEDDEMIYVVEDGPKSLRLIMEIIEAKIYEECQNIIRGEVAAKETIESLKQLSDYYDYTMTWSSKNGHFFKQPF